MLKKIQMNKGWLQTKYWLKKQKVVDRCHYLTNTIYLCLYFLIWWQYREPWLFWSYRQWPPAGPWWWRFRRCWEPGSCSSPRRSARRRWWSDRPSGTPRSGWTVAEVGRRTAGSGGTVTTNALPPWFTSTLWFRSAALRRLVLLTWLPSRCQNMAGWGLPVASHWKVTVLPTATTWFRGLTTNAGGTGEQPRVRS